MAMFGKVEELLPLVLPGSRLHQGLSLIQDYIHGRSPELDGIVRGQEAGEQEQIVIEGDSLYLIVQCYAPKPAAEVRFEAHRRHTDLQFVCAGKEWIEVCDLRQQTGLPAYDADGNVFFPRQNVGASRLLVAAGNIAVLFPNDAHAPCLRVEESSKDLVRKVVVKIKDALQTASQQRSIHHRGETQSPSADAQFGKVE